MAENYVLYTQLGAGLCMRQHLSEALKEVRTQPWRSLGEERVKPLSPPTEHISLDTRNQSDWSQLTTAHTTSAHSRDLKSFVGILSEISKHNCVWHFPPCIHVIPSLCCSKSDHSPSKNDRLGQINDHMRGQHCPTGLPAMMAVFFVYDVPNGSRETGAYWAFETWLGLLRNWIFFSFDWILPNSNLN